MKNMLCISYSLEKNTELKQTRGVGFEDVVLALKEGNILDILKHHNPKKYPSQKIYVININKYVYLVPFVKQDAMIFLKTIFPSRKFTKKYLQTSI